VSIGGCGSRSCRGVARLERVIRDGRDAGDRTFPPPSAKPSELEIIEAEAGIVHRVFAKCIAGKTPRNIAIDLACRRLAARLGRPSTLWFGE